MITSVAGPSTGRFASHGFDFQFNTTQIPYYYIGLALLIGALLSARAKVPVRIEAIGNPR